jgi:hypothetical protein
MATDTRIGTEIAGYRIESLLGRGGMSVVYLAEDIRLKRKAALKLLTPDMAEDEGFRERFVSESELAASLDHPNVIPIFEAGEADGVLFIAMRYVKTTDLKLMIKTRGSLDAKRTISLLAQTASALDDAAEHGLVHRDVKPGNILVAEGLGTGGTDHVYLSDFGLTKRQDAPTGLTRTGQFVGTVDYVAPEQIEGKPIDGRTDQYALACVLYECLTGHAPYPKDAETAVLIAHLMESPPRVTAERPELRPEIDNVIAKAMAKNKDDRYANCSAFIKAAGEALGVMPGTASGPLTYPGSTFQPGGAPMAPAGAPQQFTDQSPTHYAAPPFQPPAGPYETAPQATPQFAPAPGQTAPPGVVAPPDAPPKRRSPLLIGGIAAAAVIAAVLAFVVLGGGGNKPQTHPSGGTQTGGGIPTQGNTEPVKFSDDFSSKVGQWDDFDNAALDLGYANGGYKVLIKTDNAFATAIPHVQKVQRLGDVTVSVDARALKAPDPTTSTYGLACRTNQGTLSYYFVITSAGTYAIEKSDGTPPTEQLKSSSSPLIRKGQAVNHIEGTCEGGDTVTLTLTVNGTVVDTAVDSSQPALPTGSVGVTAVGLKGTEIRFDNFKVDARGSS